jgi:hypothetical protein
MERAFSYPQGMPTMLIEGNTDFDSYVYQSILDQVNRDQNVKTLLEDIHDVFNLGKLVDSLGAVKSGSTQAQILTAMLQLVCNCGDFIQSYAKNTQFCMYLLPN